MRRPLILLLALAACTPEPPEAEVWLLATMGGVAVAPGVTLELSPIGALSGQGPCNRYFGSYTGPLQDFRPAGLGSTEMACDRLDEEIRYFAALGAATRAEISGDVLTVTGGAVPLTFRRGR